MLLIPGIPFLILIAHEQSEHCLYIFFFFIHVNKKHAAYERRCNKWLRIWFLLSVIFLCSFFQFLFMEPSDPRRREGTDVHT